MSPAADEAELNREPGRPHHISLARLLAYGVGCAGLGFAVLAMIPSGDLHLRLLIFVVVAWILLLGGLGSVLIAMIGEGVKLGMSEVLATSGRMLPRTLDSPEDLSQRHPSDGGSIDGERGDGPAGSGWPR